MPVTTRAAAASVVTSPSVPEVNFFHSYIPGIILMDYGKNSLLLR